MILVSVLMTAYNREKYIAEAIESVLCSTFKNFELIIVDDLSADRTLDIARGYETKDDRVRVYRNDKNLGQFANRNKAAELAVGKYIKYLDSDDIIYPYGLAVMVNAMESFPEAGLGFCYTSGDSPWPLPKLLTSAEAYSMHYKKGGILFCGPSGLIMRRDIFWNTGGYEDYGMPSDNHLSLKIAATSPVVPLQRDLFWWRKHEGQAFNNANLSVNALNNYRFNKSLIDSHLCPLNKRDKDIITKNLKRIFLKNIVRIGIKSRKPFEAFELISKSKIL
ncbi:glycosyltransferase family 2 protein [Pontibacter sp. BT310]|uniref:Glycosyltransferase n=1 Tax=Pontibacter populi TaxID=890055 RepID=A0ABS6XF80_9BACT|nr:MULTISPECIES: glycosyltransferase family 2 protein [Pontibacter]MBJ6119800.1 glycosyltransferase family 2 protein [Pontibacter sp. BT310]MBR0572229.1 glycosyltransferase family 2 protein [Microvirga sp. STS03]MBW3366653.1 glycosyltransferase [Pontibacter populi]